MCNVRRRHLPAPTTLRKPSWAEQMDGHIVQPGLDLADLAAGRMQDEDDDVVL